MIVPKRFASVLRECPLWMLFVPVLLVLLGGGFATPGLRAGELRCDFNGDLPKALTLRGSAVVVKDSLMADTGFLQLTPNKREQTGACFFAPLDGDRKVHAIEARFTAKIGGGTGADGFSLSFGPDISGPLINEKGAGSGLVVQCDTYDGRRIRPTIMVMAREKPVGVWSLPDMRTNEFTPYLVKLDPDGTLDLVFGTRQIVTNHPTGLLNLSGRFAFGARTGAHYDNHWIDDVHFVTRTQPGPYVDTFEPTGDNAAPRPWIQVFLRDHVARVDDASIQLFLDGVKLDSLAERQENGVLVTHAVETASPAGSQHEVRVVFAGDTTPAVEQEFRYAFVVTSAIQVDQPQPGAKGSEP